MQRAVEMSRERGIQSGMFLMWGYEGEEMEDIEATIFHVSKARPDVFVTPVSYPIKGTPYYRQIESKLVQLKPWSQSSDREIKIKGRHSQQYYSYADKLLRDEVQLSRLIETPTVDAASIEGFRRPASVVRRSGLIASERRAGIFAATATPLDSQNFSSPGAFDSLAATGRRFLPSRM